MIRSTLKRMARRLVTRTPPAPPRAPAPPLPDAEELTPPAIEVDGDDVARWLADGSTFELLDIRELGEVRHGHATGARLIPMNQVPGRLAELPPPETRLLVYCAAGARSYGVVEFLRDQGYVDAWSLIGGLSAWVAAGGEHERPPSSVPWPPASRVSVAGEPGTVQRITGDDAGIRYDVAVVRDGRRVLLTGLDETALSSP